MPDDDPYKILKITPNADVQTIKKAFRELAFKYHPDKDPSPEAAARFVSVRRAAERLLATDKSWNAHQYDADAIRRAWAAAANGAQYQHSRSRSSVGMTLAFCGASIIGGIALFFGALYVHDGLYESNIYKPQDDMGRQPTPQQMMILERLQQKRDEAKMTSGTGSSSPR